MLEALRQKLRRGELGTLSTVMQQMLGALGDPASSARRLGRIAASDQVLCAAVLRLANSAYYGLPQQVGDVGQAIALIGFGALRELVMSITTYDLIMHTDSGSFDREELWQHSLHVACCSRLLARRYPNVPGEVVFVAGLLHEVGYTLLDQHAHGVFAQLLDSSRHAGGRGLAQEQSLAGVSHGDIGGWAAEAWNLPGVLQSAIRYHHVPFDAPGEHVVPAAIVAMADVLHREHFWWEPEPGPLLSRLHDYLELNAGETAQLLHQTAQEVGLVRALVQGLHTPTSAPSNPSALVATSDRAGGEDLTTQQRIRS